MKKIRIKYALILSLTLTILSTWAILSWLNDDKPVYDSSSIVQSIEQISELSLVQYNYTTVIGLKQSKSLGNASIPFTEKSFLATFDGQIKAGVVLTPDIFESASKDNKSIKLTLPKAQINSHSIDEHSLIVYDQSRNIINQIKIEDYNNAIVEEKANMEAKALESGIIKQADERAALLIENMLRDMGYENIEIVFAAA